MNVTKPAPADKEVTKPAPAEYEVTTAREIGGRHRKLGEILTLAPGQAKYYLPPYGTGLSGPIAPKVSAKPATAQADDPADRSGA